MSMCLVMNRTMKKIGIRKVLLVLALFVTNTLMAEVPSEYKEQYRRSSLCLVLLNHTGKKYTKEMERVFWNFPLPARYNEHNITDVKVINVSRKQSQSDIEKLLKNNHIAQKVVGRWFNWDSNSGYMNMDLIHERGGYGASYADYQRAMTNVRGTSMLRDEGIELLQSTFVLVCDMDYIDKSKGSRWGALALALASAGAAVMSGVQQNEAYSAASRGDYAEARRKQNQATAWQVGSQLGQVGAAVVADIGGFRVKMNAYLYKLRWDDRMTQTMYNQYWCDSDMSASEVANRRNGFTNTSQFSLEFVGKYKTTSSKTILRSWKNEDEVILDVCRRCVDKGMKELAKTFEVFRPRAPFYFEDGQVYSHIGKKEDVTYGRQYEILQPYKDKKGQINYKRVGKAQAGAPWDNREIRFDQYFNNEDKGTLFYCKASSSVDLHTPGLQLREL